MQVRSFSVSSVLSVVNILFNSLDFRFVYTTHPQKNGQPLLAAHVLNVLFRLPMSTAAAAVAAATTAADVSTTASAPAVVAAAATAAGARR